MAVTSTQGLVITLITKKVQGLDLAGVIGLPCPVFDGPEGTDNEDNFVVVHAWPGTDTGQTAQWVGLGARARDENYDVAVAVCCYQGGASAPDSTGTDDVQLAVRTNANAIAAAIEQALIDDITLATQNGGTPPAGCCWLTVSQQPLDSNPPEGLSGMGRFAQITMRVHFYARLLSS
jgi:hypothetical protein